ncbi:MAG: transglycosylase SLT domain-containing protein, partial [Rubrivivax sp.]|nr:transglycosylase SLT domain-containing protein [Rubrivivax sp.]
DPRPAPAAIPRGRFDPLADAARSDLWQRLRQGYAMPDVDGELVRKWEQWYASRPDYVQRMTERGGRYLFHIIEEIERRGMPADLALLPFIESAFNPQALSSARAAGMWQFMPATGRDFELKQNLFRDDRRDVLASTRAALDYLQLLYTKFGDWHLALAAYNWGQGNVQRAIQRNLKAGLRTDYLGLSMPDETRNYVPKLQAVKNIVARPQEFAVKLPLLENHPFFLTVAIDRDIDVALVAELAGLPVEDFKQLNPQLNKPVILAAGTPQVLLPYDNANRFISSLALRIGPLASWTAWVAPSTLKPADAARQVGMSDASLREANRIPPGMVVKAGSTLMVSRSLHAVADVSEQVADQAMLTLAPEGKPLRRVAFKAGQKGDSVAGVARRYGLPAAQVAAWNSVELKAAFKPGELIVVMLGPAKPSAAAKPRTAGKPAAPRRAAPAAPTTQRR